MSLRFQAHNLANGCDVDILDICLKDGIPLALRYQRHGKIITAPIDQFNLTMENIND